MITWQKRPPRRWAAAAVVTGAVTAVLASPLAIGTAAAATGTLTVDSASQNQNLPTGSTATFHLHYTGGNDAIYYTITNSSPARTTNYPGDVAPASHLCNATPTGGAATCTITSDGTTTGTDLVEFFQDSNTVSPSPNNTTATDATPTQLTFSGQPNHAALTPTSKTSPTNTCVVYTLSATDASGLPSGNRDFNVVITETPNTATFKHYDANCANGVTGGSFSVTTGNDGTVKFGVSSDTASTSAQIAATAVDGGTQAFATPTWTAGGANSVTQLAVTPPSTTDYVNSTEHFTVTATDAGGNPVQGVTVNEETTSGPATSPDLSTTAAGYPVSCGTTDQNGKVTCNVTNGGAAGTDNLTFWVNKTVPPSGCTSLGQGPDAGNCNEATTTATATFNALPAVGSAPADFTLTCPDQTTAIGGAQTNCTVPASQSAVTWTATVKDSSGNPIQGVVVDFTASGAPVTAGTATPATGQDTTNASGVATFTVTHPNAANNDQVNVTATIGDPAHGGFTAGPSTVTWKSSTATELKLTPPVQSAAAGDTISVLAQVVDQFGNGISTVDHLSYSVVGRNPKAPTTITTSNGSATITYKDTGTVGTLDTISVTDTDNPGLGGKTATVQYVTGTSTATSVKVDTSGPTPGPCGAAADQPKTGATFETVYPVCAVVTNEKGEVLAGKTVTFTVSNGRITSGNSAPASIPSSASNSVAVTTDQNGVATAYATSDTTGVQTVTATSGSASGSSTITYTAPAANTAMKIAVAPSPATVAPGGSQKFTFTVTDQYGNGVSGVVVAITQNGPGILTAGSGNQTTDANGQVSALLSTQSTDTGSGSVTGNITNNAPPNQCAATGGTCTATATYVVKSGPAHLTLTAEHGAKTTTHETVQAVATNDNGTPSANQVVRFFVSGANSATGAATTDASGHARFSYLAKHHGKDTIAAYVDTNNDGIRTADEPRDSVTAHILGREKPTISLHAKHGKVRVNVDTHPNANHAFVRYYLKKHGVWHFIGSSHTNGTGFDHHTFREKAGSHKTFRVKVSATINTTAGTSKAKSVRVR